MTPDPNRGGTPPRTSPRRPIGEVLVEAGVVTEEQVAECLLAVGSGRGGRLGNVLVAKGYASEQDVARGLAQSLHLEHVSLSSSEVVPAVARLLPRAMAERLELIPVARDQDQLIVAMTDPTDVVALDDVRLYTRVRTISVVVAARSAVMTSLQRVWGLGEHGESITLEGLTDEAEDLPDDVTAAGVDDAPIVRLFNEILVDAVRADASDIHLECERGGIRVRYRVDGLLRDVTNVPGAAKNALISRAKIVSGLNIAERRLPQDGRMRFEVEGRSIDARVSTLPALHGEKVVVRLLAHADRIVPLAKVGLSGAQLEVFLQTMVAPQGLILVTGPTGSGKTSTLYSAVTQLRTPDRNIVSLEDPIEMQLTGVTQVQVRERAGMTFAKGLRSILRQDPDVILVGEVRDQETAELALRASLTGHLVFTTLHTNDAATAVTRLVDMGVEPYLIASSLALVAAQRLVRMPCSGCAVPYQPSPRLLELLGLTPADVWGHPLRRGAGCDACGMTGYLGRTAIFELLNVDARMRAVLTASPTESAIRHAARAAEAGTLRSHGIAKALRGETTLEEILRVTKLDAGSIHRCGSCRRVIDEGMPFCPWCTTPADQHSCLSCNARLEPDWPNCPWCRTATGGAEKSPIPPHGLPISVPAPPHRPTVLIVDDDPSICAFVAVALVDVAEVLAAATAEEALRVCALRDIDTAILDLHLPDLSGVEITRLLRSDERTALMPLLLMTGSSDAALLDEARRAGVDDVVAKPVEPAELEQRVLALLAKSPVSISPS